MGSPRTLGALNLEVSAVARPAHGLLASAALSAVVQASMRSCEMLLGGESRSSIYPDTVENELPPRYDPSAIPSMSTPAQWATKRWGKLPS